MSDLLSYAQGGAGFQKHSRTSRNAAEKVNSKGQRKNVLKYIEECGSLGATTDEIKTALLERGLIHANSVMSARVRELEMDGDIVKTTVERRTRAGHPANVVVTAEIFSRGGFTREISKPAAPTRPKTKWHKFEKWHDDLGFVLWHLVPVEEPPFAGCPHDSDWPYSREDEPNLRWCVLPEGPTV